MKIDEIIQGMRVAYVPMHALGDMTHQDVETGKVSSKNSKYAFVRFDKSVAKLGWDGATSQSCDPEDLVPLTNWREEGNTDNRRLLL